MSATITIIATPAEDPDQFESMYVDERRHRSAGWRTFPLRSGRSLDSFFLQATGSDLGVFEGEPEIEIDGGEKLRTCMIDRTTLVEVLPKLEAMVETNADETARALWAHGGRRADLARVREALTSGAWPATGDLAEEAAAFARSLLDHARAAKEERMGVCWEYRGELTA